MLGRGARLFGCQEAVSRALSNGGARALETELLCPTGCWWTDPLSLCEPGQGGYSRQEREELSPYVFFSCELNTTNFPPCAAGEAVCWADKAGALSLCHLGWQRAGNATLLFCVLNFWRWGGSVWRTPSDLSCWQLEGIWWPGSLVAFQSHLLCMCRS